MGAFDHLIPGNGQPAAGRPRIGAFDHLVPGAQDEISLGGMLDKIMPTQEERRAYLQRGSRPNEAHWADFMRPAFGGHNPVEETTNLVAPAVDPTSDRGVIDRAKDTVAFVANSPVRMLTRGQYNIDDAVRWASGGAVSAEGLGDAEASFVANNPELLNLLGRIGEIAPGVTRGLGQGVPRSPVPTATVPAELRPNAQSGRLAQHRAAEAVRDVRAFDETGVPLVPLAFAGAPTRGLGRQLSETPVIGSPLHNNMESAYRGLKEAQVRTADAIHPASTPEQAGSVMQRGLDRFRTARFDDTEPGIVQGFGVNPRVAVQPANVMSANAQARANQAAAIIDDVGGGQAVTQRGRTVAAARPQNQTLTARTGIEDVDDAALAAILRAPARETSFATRQEALYESAHRKLPPQMRIDDTANPQLLRAVNAQNVFRGIAADEARSGITSGMLRGRYGGMAERLNRNVTLTTLRQMRTEVGRALGNFGLYETGLDRTQLRQIYGAISRDIEIAYLDLRNRAYIKSRVSQNRPDHIPLAVARAADRALYEFRRADRYTRLGLDRMDRFASLVGAKSPDQAVRQLVAAAKQGGSANMGLVRNAMGVLRPEERAAFGSMLVREMGYPINSARGLSQEVKFSPQTFVTNYQALTPEARAIIFGPDHARAIENLFRVSNRIANVEALTNFSRSGTNVINVGGLASGLASIARGDVVTPMAVGGGMAAAALLLSRPSYARWATRYMQLRAVAARSPERLNTGVVRLARELRQMAKTDQELLTVLDMLEKDHGISRSDGGED